MQVDFDLIKKYNVSGPRYTSYPTALQFEEQFNERELKKYLGDRNREPRPISIYVHLPFCFSLCWYCGCTKIVTRDQNRADTYLDFLEYDMEQVKSILHPRSCVQQVHFGGGTPTFLSADQLRRLGNSLRSRFQFANEVEYSIEIDPRRLSHEQVRAMKDIGCNRASLGIQDTNRSVQEAVHRIQPQGTNRQVVKWLRDEGINAINVDLIYGLPRQTLTRFKQTLSDVLELQPDRLAVYSYAHVPWIKPSQKLINTEDLPSSDEKLRMMQTAVSTLTDRGFRYIGMDHFAREGDALCQAMDQGTLQRNFQGYSTHARTDLYALGMSGISQVGNCYFQKFKDLRQYYGRLEEDQWPVQKTMWRSRDDRIRGDVIMRIMCKNFVSFSRIERRWNIEMRSYFAKELQQLRSLEKDDLIRQKANGFEVTTTGRLFLRNIAMVFDRYLSEQQSKRSFSKTV